jgi:hypothetical protein
VLIKADFSHLVRCQYLNIEDVLEYANFAHMQPYVVPTEHQILPQFEALVSAVSLSGYPQRPAYTSASKQRENLQHLKFTNTNRNIHN